MDLPAFSRRSSVAEQRFRKPQVGGSIPLAGSIFGTGFPDPEETFFNAPSPMITNTVWRYVDRGLEWSPSRIAISPKFVMLENGKRRYLTKGLAK